MADEDEQFDVARYLRLRGAVDGALTAHAEEHAVMASDSMVHAYVSLRQEVRATIPSEHHEEFDRLFPVELPDPRGDLGSRPMRAAMRFEAARGALGRMSGWLDGFVQAAKMHLEATAYAQERVRREKSGEYL
jgi:hypothetical protein